MGDDAGKRRWLSRLTSSKRAILGRVLKRRAISQALYALHGIPGLWEDSDGFNIGVLHKMLAIMSDEVRRAACMTSRYLRITLGTSSIPEQHLQSIPCHRRLQVPTQIRRSCHCKTHRTTSSWLIPTRRRLYNRCSPTRSYLQSIPRERKAAATRQLKAGQ